MKHSLKTHQILCCVVLVSVFKHSEELEILNHIRNTTFTSTISGRKSTTSPINPSEVGAPVYKIHLIKQCKSDGSCSYNVQFPPINIVGDLLHNNNDLLCTNIQSEILSKKLDKLSKQVEELKSEQTLLLNDNKPNFMLTHRRLTALINAIKTKEEHFQGTKQKSLARKFASEILSDHYQQQEHLLSTFLNKNEESKDALNQQRQHFYPPEALANKRHSLVTTLVNHVGAFYKASPTLALDSNIVDEGSTFEDVLTDESSSIKRSKKKDATQQVLKLYYLLSEKLFALEAELLARIVDSEYLLSANDPHQAAAITENDELTPASSSPSKVEKLLNTSKMKFPRSDVTKLFAVAQQDEAVMVKDGDKEGRLLTVDHRQSIYGESGKIITQIETPPLVNALLKGYLEQRKKGKKLSSKSDEFKRDYLHFKEFETTATPVVMTTHLSSIHDITLPDSYIINTSTTQQEDEGSGSLRETLENYQRSVVMKRGSDITSLNKTGPKFDLTAVKVETSITLSNRSVMGKSLKDENQTADKSMLVITRQLNSDVLLELSSAANGSLQKYKLQRTATIYSKADIPYDCAEIYLRGERRSGVYQIRPRKRGVWRVHCDMDTNGGGWTTLQKRIKGETNFTRSWREYQVGFGNVDGDHWMGLEKMHYLTATTKIGKLRLRIDLTDWDNVTHCAQYDVFKVKGETRNYQLIAKKYSGTAGDALNYGDKYNHDMQPFTTFDRDNDDYTQGNCGEYYGSGWWFNSCFAANLNGVYHKRQYKGRRKGIYWGTWYKLSGQQTKDHYSFKSVDMKVRPLHFKPKN